MAVLFVFAYLMLLAAASPLFSPHELHNLIKRQRAPPSLPGNDPWYAAPDNLAAAAPGDILKWRPAPRALSTDNSRAINVQAMYQIQYRTQNSVGAPIANVLTAIVPHNARMDALFSYIYFSDVPNPNCNPSLSMTLQTDVPADWVKQQMGPIIAALSEGWIVAVPDDGGPQASFPSGPNMAYNTLDSMRAMLRSQEVTGLAPDATVTLNGYSGGGIAAAWTGELHPGYAPELKIDGIALGGLIPDFVYLSGEYILAMGRNGLTQLDLIRTGQGMFRWGPVAFAGLSHDYPELATWLDANLVPERAAEFWQVETMCIEASSQFYANRNTCEYFTRGCAAWDDEIPARILREATTMGLQATPSAPWYLYAVSQCINIHCGLC